MIENIPKENEKKLVVFTFKEVGLIFLSGLFLAIIHNYLLYGFSNGPGEFLFSIFFILTIYLLFSVFNIKLYKDFFVVAFFLIIFSFFKIIRVGEIINFLNSISIYFLYLFLIKIIIKDKFVNIKAYDYFPGFIKTFFGGILGIGIWIGSLLKLGFKFPKFENNKHIIKGILMSLPLVFVFSVLFSSADLVFSKILSQILDWNIFDFINLTSRFINIFFIFLLILGFLTYIFFQIRGFLDKNDEKKFDFDDKKHIEINIVLGVISVLFIIFVSLQIGYLFSGESFIISQGYTYSEYARKGFVELAFCAFIVFVLLWKIDEYLYGHQKTTGNIYKILSSWLIFLTILILFSAFYRLWLYENAYGFTEIRFYGYLFIIILFLSLVFTLYKTLFFVKEGTFIVINIYFYFLGLIFANIFNPEAYISQYNTNKIYRGSISTDFSYIGGRSMDAVDSMLISYEKTKDDEKKSMDWQICNMIEKVENRKIDWREYNYSYKHAYDVLIPLKPKFNCKKIID